MSNDITVTIERPGPELFDEASGLLDLAKGYEITCPEMRKAASEDLVAVKTKYKEIEARQEKLLVPLRDATKEAREIYRAPLEFLLLAESTLKRAMLGWDDKVARAKREAELSAKKAADEERKRMLVDAAAAQAEGRTETAQAIHQAAALVAPVPVRSFEQPKAYGESVRELWRAEPDEEAGGIVALARAVGEGLVPPDCLLMNMPILNKRAQALKQNMDTPGVKAVSEKVLASRLSR